MQRREVSDEVLLHVIQVLTQKVGARLEKHGRGAFASSHEAYGVFSEENWELVEALKNNDPYRIADEWFDIATTGVFAVASMIDSSTVQVEGETGDDCEEGTCENDTGITGVEDAAERARKLMIERARQSNLEIATTF